MSTTLNVAQTVAPQVPAFVTHGSRRIMERIATSNNPVIVVAVAAAIVLGVGFIAYLTAQCISHGYRGFAAVVDIDRNAGGLSADVTTECYS